MATATTKRPAKPRATVKRAELETVLRRITKRAYPTSAQSERQFVRSQLRSLLGEDAS